MLPSIFSTNLFDDFFDFPFYDDNRAVDQAEKKLYGHHAANLMKTDIKELETMVMNLKLIFQASRKRRSKLN